MRFTLLGSGCCRCDLDRWGPAQVLEIGGEILLFDCGRGATMRMQQAGIPFQDIRDVFFTHHHYDHNCDFIYFFLTGWLMGRQEPLRIYGPRGTERFVRSLFDVALADDIASRREHPIFSENGWRREVLDVVDPVWEHQGGGWTLSAIHTVHMAPHLDNLAYKIQAEGKTVVIAGDNIVCDNLMDFAQDADLLVHECTFPSDRIKRANWERFHTPPRDLGRWARERNVKRLLIRHFAVQDGVAVEPMAAEVREEFGDEGLLVGRDLMVVDI